mgnify:CR=1 FL=1
MGIETTSGIIAFAWLALAMTLAPGSDTVLVIRSSLRDGTRAGVAAAAGIVLGVIVWGGLAGLGVALLLVRLPVVYRVVAIGGGVYLAYLSVMTFVSARRLWRSDPAVPDDSGEATPRRSLPQTFIAGLLTNLLNPKIGVFYLSIMPGLFIGQGLTLWLGLELGGIHAALGIVWLSIVSVLATWARRHLLRAKPRAVLDGICGALLLAFGVLVIVEVVMQTR